ncbi:unnamed protein product [Parajaminaea phylloscopi]
MDVAAEASSSRCDTLRALIPALSRDAAADPAWDTPSVNEQLTRSRLAARPAQAKWQSDGAGSSVSMPQGGRSSGVGFMTAAVLKAADAQRYRDTMALRRKFAGPMPPQSWRGGVLPEVESEEGTRHHRQNQINAVGASQNRRKQVNAAWTSLREDLVGPAGKRRLRSLKDSCAAAVCDILNEADRSVTAATAMVTVTEAAEVAPYLPLHVKSNIMRQAGSESQTAQPLRASTFRALWPPGDHREEEPTDTEMLDGRCGSDGDNAVDWDVNDASFGGGDASTPQSRLENLDTLDLAFASLGTQLLRRSIQPDASKLLNVHLRSLNLAGASLSTGLFFKTVCTSLPNLVHLGLAGANLQTHSGSYEARRFDRLWQVSIKLQSLDLSFCSPLLGNSVLKSLIAAPSPPPALCDVFLRELSDEGYVRSAAAWSTKCSDMRIRHFNTASHNAIEGTWLKLRHYEPAELEALEAARGTRVPVHVSENHALRCNVELWKRKQLTLGETEGELCPKTFVWGPESGGPSYSANELPPLIVCAMAAQEDQATIFDSEYHLVSLRNIYGPSLDAWI